MTIRTRIKRLEAKRAQSMPEGPMVVFLCGTETGEPISAIIIGGGSISREPGESREAFEAIIMAGGPTALSLPERGRDALATGKAPSWARGELLINALAEKYRNHP